MMKRLVTILLLMVHGFAPASHSPAQTGQVELYRKRETSNCLPRLSNASCKDIVPVDSSVCAYMKQYGIVGATLAVSRNDSLLYVKGYGWSDRENGELMQPDNIMRIASVSKLLTAVGIMKLCEKGQLSLSDKVFSSEGPLGKERFTSVISDSMMFDITVEDLLRHKGGFNERGGDPMFRNGALEGREVIRNVLAKPLAFKPGTSQHYSNTGYYLLSLIIENLGGTSYENWIQTNILAPLQCTDFHIGGNYLSDRLPRESRYYMHKDAAMVHDFHNTGILCECCYGGNNVTRLSGAGAWVTSAPELCRFVAGIDNKIEIWDILNRESIAAMTEYFDPRTYSLGWNDTNEDGVWTRTGSFSGTTAIIKYFSKDGDCWVLLTNTSTWLGPGISRRSGALIKTMREKYLELLPRKNLFIDCAN